MIKKVLLIAAVIVFALATFNVHIGTANMLALGLALGFGGILSDW